MHADDFSQPEQFPHPVATIQWRETHISQIILTGEWVYKVKKAVNFGFLDFSTLELRKHFCEEEVRLNRRTAPNLYVSVEALYCDDGQFNFCGRGALVDYAVKMRQFDPEALLLNRMPQVGLEHEFFQSLGYELARFHEAAAISGAEHDFGDAAAVRFPVEENFRQIAPRIDDVKDRACLQHLERWSELQSERLSALFDMRKQQGRIRECHGDLHLANIALIDERPVLFDCIEFNPRLRWIDVASDLAFLIMDLGFNGYPEQANQLLNSYLEYSADYELLTVLNYYIVYRAMVRAKVAVLRMEQAAEAEQAELRGQFRAYVAFARATTEQTNSYLAITCGVSGSGKSTLARKLAAHSAAIHLRSDVVRKQLAGLKPLQSSEQLDPDNPDWLYSREYTEKTFARLKTLAEQALGLGYPTIVDATFLSAASRQPFIAIAERLTIPFYLLYLEVPPAELRRRIGQRQRKGGDASEADAAIMEEQLSHFESFSASEEPYVIRFHGAVNAGSIKELEQLMLAKARS